MLGDRLDALKRLFTVLAMILIGGHGSGSTFYQFVQALTMIDSIMASARSGGFSPPRRLFQNKDHERDKKARSSQVDPRSQVNMCLGQICRGVPDSETSRLLPFPPPRE
jgi:hypothetical protein